MMNKKEYCQFDLTTLCLLIDSMGAVPFLKIYLFLSYSGNPNILWNPKMLYRLLYGLPLVPFLTQINSVPYRPI